MDFKDILKPGMQAEISITLTEENAASSWGSGALPVFATPSMIAYMEGAAHSAISYILPEGWSSVGTEVNIKHLSATPLGLKVSAKAELLEIDGRALSFKVEAFDEAGKIGEGSHKRFLIETEKFMSRTEEKLKKIEV